MIGAVAGPASAAAADRTVTQVLAGTAAPISLFDTGLQVCDDCVPDIFVSNFDSAGAGAQLSADIGTHWTSDVATKVSYDDSQLRQGSSLPTQDAFKSTNGVITATFSLDAFIGLVVKNDGDADWSKTTTSVSPHVSKDITIPCQLPRSAGRRTFAAVVRSRSPSRASRCCPGWCRSISIRPSTFRPRSTATA